MSVSSALAETSIKKAVGKRARRGESLVAWADVLRALPADDTRSLAMRLYRAPGWEPDHFARLIAARMAMADALTRTEDWLEIEHPQRWRREREALRAVRRRLEWELWP